MGRGPCPTSTVRHPIHDIRVPVSESRHPCPDIRVMISESRYPSPDIRHDTRVTYPQRDTLRATAGDIRVPISESRYPSHDMRVTISESRYPSHDIRVMISESRIRGETRCALRPAAARRSPTGSESRYPRHEFAAGCESVGRAGGGRDGGRTVRGRRPRGPSPPRTMKMQSSTTLRSQQGTGIPTIFGTLFSGPGPPPPPVGHASDARGREQSRATDRSPRQRVSNASVSWTKA